MKKVVFAFLGLCTLACVEKEMPDTAEPTAAQRVCKVDADCILANISCNGCCQEEAINKKDSAGYAARKLKLCVGKLTSVCDCSPLPSIAKCLNTRCEVVATGEKN